MADLNELNEKVEQIKADIREQLEKIYLATHRVQPGRLGD